MLGLHHQTDLEAFWTDATVRHAATTYKNEKKKEAQQNHDSAGAASPQEKSQLQNEQEQRAKLRESMKQAGKQAPSGEGQLDRLSKVREKREQAGSPDRMNNDHG